MPPRARAARGTPAAVVTPPVNTPAANSQPAAAASSSAAHSNSLLFTNISAWFAPTAICKTTSQQFLSNGGSVVSDASSSHVNMHLSSDASDESTASLQRAGVVVVKSSWVMESIQAKKIMPIGKYVLTPQSVHTTLLHSFFSKRTQADKPYTGTLTEEDKLVAADGGDGSAKKRRRRVKESQAAKAAEAEALVQSTAPAIAAANQAKQKAANDAAATAAAASTPSYTYQLPENSGFIGYAALLRSNFGIIPPSQQTPPIVSSSTAAVPSAAESHVVQTAVQPAAHITHVVAGAAPSSAGASAAVEPPAPASEKKKKKGAKRKVDDATTTQPEPAPATTDAAPTTLPSSSSVPPSSQLPSLSHVPSLSHSNLFGFHWIRLRTPIELKSLVPYMAPKHSFVIPAEGLTQPTPIPTAAAAPVAGGKKGKRKGVETAVTTEQQQTQVPAAAQQPVQQPPAAAQSKAAPTTAQPSPNASTEEGQPPQKKQKKGTKPVAKSAPSAVAAATQFSLNLSTLTAADYEAADVALTESSTRNLRVLAQCINCLSVEGASPAEMRDFELMTRNPKWREKFKRMLLNYWASMRQ